MCSLQNAKANVHRILEVDVPAGDKRIEGKWALIPNLNDMQNQVGVFRRSQNTILCSAWIGAAPQQEETPHFHFCRNEGFLILWPQIHYLRLLRHFSNTNDIKT